MFYTYIEISTQSWRKNIEKTSNVQNINHINNYFCKQHSGNH